MPNILLTNYCNRACPYCFAKDKIGVKSNSHMSISLENIEYIINFLKRSNHEVFSVLGGEPTLHPKFQNIIDRVMENNFKVRVFTNGLINKEKQKYIFRNNIKIVLNINSPDNTTDSRKEKLRDVYEYLGPNIYPGFNIFKENFDFSFIYDLIDKYHMAREIRLGLSQPIVSYNNKYILPDQYRSIGKKIVILAESASQRNIKLNFDCGFVLCMFTKSDVGKLIYSNTDLGFKCGPAIDIDPELNVWSCFPLSSIKNRSLKNFNNLEEIITYYKKIFRKYSNIGILKKCNTCLFLKRQQCTGGCISHKILNKYVNSESLV